jgi:hypothetical protein
MAYHSNDAKDLSEILDVVSTKMPDMLTNLLKTVYSVEAGRNVGQAVGSLFKELVDAGIPREMALKMASDYMISFKDLLGTINPAVCHAATDNGEPPSGDK